MTPLSRVKTEPASDADECVVRVKREPEECAVRVKPDPDAPEVPSSAPTRPRAQKRRSCSPPGECRDAPWWHEPVTASMAIGGLTFLETGKDAGIVRLAIVG